MPDSGHLPSTPSRDGGMEEERASRPSSEKDDGGGRLPSRPDDSDRSAPSEGTDADRSGTLPSSQEAETPETSSDPSSPPPRHTSETGADAPSQADSRQERIRRATADGGLDTLPDRPAPFGDPENGDWQVAKSEDPFERLYLDHRQYEDITSETVRRHYELISSFWKKKNRTLESSGKQQARQIRRKYGGPHRDAEVVREHLEQTKKAYRFLNDADGRRACHRALDQERRERGREALLPLLRQSLRDEVLDPSEAEGLIETGRTNGLREEEVAEVVMERLEADGFGPEEWPDGNTRAEDLRSVRWMTKRKHRQLADRRERAAAADHAPSPEQRRQQSDPDEPSPQPEPSTSRWAWAAGVIGVLVLVAAGGIFALGGSPGSSSTSSAQQSQQQPKLPDRQPPTGSASDEKDERDSNSGSERPVAAKKRTFRNEMESKISTFDEQISKLKRKARVLKGEARENLKAEIADVKSERDAFKRKLGQLSAVSKSELPSFKSELLQREATLQRRIESVQDDASAAVAAAVEKEENREKSAVPAKIISVDAPPKLTVGESSTFTGTINEGDATPPVTHRWAFGDGATAEGLVVMHSYSEPGTYTVRFTASNESGSDTESMTVEVEEKTRSSFSFRSSASATASIKEYRFKVAVLGGKVIQQSGGEATLRLKVRQKSINYEGKWVQWGHILRKTRLTGPQGQIYEVDLAESENLGGGRVRPGETRTGTLVFHVDAPPDALDRATLRFTYFPYRDGRSARVPFSIQ